MTIVDELWANAVREAKERHLRLIDAEVIRAIGCPLRFVKWPWVTERQWHVTLSFSRWPR